ncbi:MAG: DUF1538 domain-containing protein [Clostridia bacterium]|nr:DUF1538 domain-containing protein [Clostridia bacterium]
MKHILKKKFHEALRSVLPLTVAVAALVFVFHLVSADPMPWKMLAKFGLGAVLLLLGVWFLAIGEDLALIYMGNRIGTHLAKSNKYSLLIVCAFFLGALVTVAEPNLSVFASLFPGIENRTIILTVALGAGVFLVLSVLRIIKRLPLPITLTVLYAVIFAVSFFAPKSAVPVAFDSGGVATGPVTVSFIISVGVGLAAARGGSRSAEDSFGSVAVCMAGPIIALLILGLIEKSAHQAVEIPETLHIEGVSVFTGFIEEFPVIVEEVAFALAPITVLFIIFNFAFLRLSAPRLIRIGLGVVFAFLGHTCLLTGIFAGFLPAGTYLGELTASLPNGLHLLLIPVGMLLSALIVRTEPAIHVLVEQVEDLTIGAISKRAMFTMLTIGVTAAVGLSMIRIILGLPLIWFLIGGFAVSLLLSFIVPKVFTSVAFDSGGAVSGAMTVAFMLPYAKGVCSALFGSGADVAMDAFGMIALVVIMPIITIQTSGLVYKLKLGGLRGMLRTNDDRITIIEFDSKG